jgi:hypothetical protein
MPSGLPQHHHHQQYDKHAPRGESIARGDRTQNQGIRTRGSSGQRPIIIVTIERKDDTWQIRAYGGFLSQPAARCTGTGGDCFSLQV